MALPLTDVLKPVTAEELLELFLEIAALVGLPVTAWQTGEPVLAMLTLLAQAIAKIWNDGILPILSAPFLDYCTGDILTIVAAALYGTIRFEATFAEGPGTVTNESITEVYAFAPGDLRVKGANGKFYKNRTGGALAAWDGVSAFPTLELTFVAEEIGTVATLVPNTLELVSGQIDLTVTKAVAWVGQDKERDEDLRTRARGAAAANSWNGPKLAYVYRARSTVRPDGTTIPVMRLSRPIVPGDGTLTYYMATPSGALDPSDVTLIQTNITDNVEPLCTTATMLSATNKVIDFNATVYVRRELITASVDIGGLSGAALAEFLRTAPIGGFIKTEVQSPGAVYLRELEAVVSGAHEAIFLVEATGSDTDIAASEVPVIGTVTLTVQQLNIAPT